MTLIHTPCKVARGYDTCIFLGGSVNVFGHEIHYRYVIVCFIDGMDITLKWN